MSASNKHKIGPSTLLRADGERSRTIGILSLGCPRNLVDSESILSRLGLKGYRIVEMDKADAAIVNTCAFTEEAKRESIDAILDLAALKKEGRLKKIIVYGCLAQRYKYLLGRELPEIDAFVGTPSLNHSARRFALTPKHYAYLKICESCINHCSFCVIPAIKGKFASLDRESLLEKVEKFDREKIGELNLIGQDITGYGLDLYQKPMLMPLLKQVARKVKNIRWLRLLYLYPSRINDELLDLIRDEPRICKYVDLPIQHINDRILKLMNRHTTKKEILRLIAKIRSKIPGVALRTSVIVGFPSETDKEFGELLRVIEEVKFERLGAFLYSREESTPAYDFPGQVPKNVKAARFDALMLSQQRVSEQLNRQFLGKTLEVLIEEKEGSSYLARSQYDAPEVDGLVYVRSRKPLRAGDFVEVKITDTLEYDLVGEVA
jgi:ribosomal protein S12 methylthiotransferase